MTPIELLTTLSVLFVLLFLCKPDTSEESKPTVVYPDQNLDFELPINSESPEETQRDMLHVVLHSQEELTDTQWKTHIPFEPNDPRDWHQYHGQERLKEFIQLQLDVLSPGESVKFMFIASKGQGKTTLFRIIGNKLLQKHASKYIEITPAMIKSKSKLDDLMESLEPNCILAIDEIHMFSRNIADTLLPAIEDNIYPFESGMRQLPRGICWLAATTDVGLLPEAFRDRFHILSLTELTLEDSVNILKDLSFPIEDQPALVLAKRSLGSPRELKRLFSVCRDVARNRKGSTIQDQDVDETCRLLDLDENGLYQHDRKVLEALYKNPKYYAMRKDGTRPKRYAHSERAIRALTGLDESLYRDEIEPKLLRTGFITIGTGGRELCEKTFRTYFPEAIENGEVTF